MQKLAGESATKADPTKSRLLTSAFDAKVIPAVQGSLPISVGSSNAQQEA
jgi:hypothetical protein